MLQSVLLQEFSSSLVHVVDISSRDFWFLFLNSCFEATMNDEKSVEAKTGKAEKLSALLS